jgi:hypothetical protein
LGFGSTLHSKYDRHSICDRLSLKHQITAALLHCWRCCCCCHQGSCRPRIIALLALCPHPTPPPPPVLLLLLLLPLLRLLLLSKDATKPSDMYWFTLCRCPLPPAALLLYHIPLLHTPPNRKICCGSLLPAAQPTTPPPCRGLSPIAPPCRVPYRFCSCGCTSKVQQTCPGLLLTNCMSCASHIGRAGGGGGGGGGK